MHDAALFQMAKTLKDLLDNQLDLTDLRQTCHLTLLDLFVEVIAAKELEHEAQVMPKFELIEQADDAPFELCLDGVGMLEKSYLPLAVVKSRLVQILTHLDGHEVTGLMVPALDHLTKRAAPQLLQSLIPVGQMIAIHRLIEAGLGVVAVIMREGHSSPT